MILLTYTNPYNKVNNKYNTFIHLLFLFQKEIILKFRKEYV